tara:strand:+ start:399 stop:671 length:273 start_codon:yes stop_codon:yes gene_type:complete
VLQNFLAVELLEVNFLILQDLLFVKNLHHQILHHHHFYMKVQGENLMLRLRHHLLMIILRNLKHYQCHLFVDLSQEEFLLLQLQSDKLEL